MLKRRSVWGGLTGVGFAALLASAPILADQINTNHNIGYGLALAGILAVIVGGGMSLFLSNQNDNPPTQTAKADSGSVANVGDKAVIINMPHFGDVLVAGQEEAKEGAEEDKRSFIRETTPDELVARIQSLRPLERKVIAEETYVGRWVRWSGTIRVIHPHALTLPGGGFTVGVASSRGQSASPYCSFHLISDGWWSHSTEGDRIRFEGKIDRVDSLDIYLIDVRIMDAGGPVHQSRRGLSSCAPNPLIV